MGEETETRRGRQRRGGGGGEVRGDRDRAGGGGRETESARRREAHILFIFSRAEYLLGCCKWNYRRADILLQSSAGQVAIQPASHL
jgi:hypothetical protein